MSKRTALGPLEAIHVTIHRDVMVRMDRLILSGRIGIDTRAGFVRLAIDRLIEAFAQETGDQTLIAECAQRAMMVAMIKAEEEAHRLESILLGCDAALRPMLEAGEHELARQTLRDTLAYLKGGQAWQERIRKVLEKRYPMLREP